MHTMRYCTLVVDPPWRYQANNGMGIRTAEAHYPTMSTEEIASLPVGNLAAENAHLYIWVTNPILTRQRESIAGRMDVANIARAWGFEPKSLLTWVKSEAGAGMGWYFRGDTEHVLFAVRGTLGISAENRVSNVFRGKRGFHSAKPDAFFDLVEKVSPGPYAELFARCARLGWDYPLGDQALGGVTVYPCATCGWEGRCEDGCHA
jgi:N6-adenosine-specific RNA methylase IME4